MNVAQHKPNKPILGPVTSLHLVLTIRTRSFMARPPRPRNASRGRGERAAHLAAFTHRSCPFQASVSYYPPVFLSPLMLVVLESSLEGSHVLRRSKDDYVCSCAPPPLPFFLLLHPHPSSFFSSRLWRRIAHVKKFPSASTSNGV
jgi:hypothetical protein